MSVDLEQRLRHELATVASTTRAEPDALVGILARARAGSPPARRPWRPVLVAGVVLALVLGTLVVRHQPRDQSTLFAGLPTGPPALTGSVVAMTPWDGLLRLDVADAGGAGEAIPDGGGTLLTDGRIVRSAGSPILVTPGSSPSVELPVERSRDSLGSVAALAEGRVVMIVTIDWRGSARRVLRTFDPKSRTFTDQPLPSDFKVARIAVGPDGSIAVVGERTEHLWEDPELVIFGPGGKQRRFGLGGIARKRYADSFWDISWGSSGLIAISTLRARWPAVRHTTGFPGAWTLVVDPRTGHVVQAMDGYEGLAWSPDGSGLLTARKTGPDTSQLVVWWGPRLKERIDLGGTRSLMPLWWRS